jgi:glycosyltransferase involved in cell wall biosynthesis
MTNFESKFIASGRVHILMITNHGVHQWKVVPGLPDTGGQNVFVNQFSEALAKLVFKITIVNRGGYPHPKTEKKQLGVHYKDEHQRLLYLEDGCPEFVRKEDMDAQLPALAKNLQSTLSNESTQVDLIISHYWDGAKLGIIYNQSLENSAQHIWVPHSLGAVKKRNVEPEKWKGLRIDERIANEHKIIGKIDMVAATSATIRQSLVHDYGWPTTPLFLPPCIDPARYHPRVISNNHEIWDFLSGHSGLSASQIRACKIITEVSRTDTTKRKDILIKAFARILARHPDSLLVTTIDQSLDPLGIELMKLIKSLEIQQNTIVLGSVWDQLPDIYAISDIYCTPSVMEGFGMSPQEAAATHVPTVSSNLVPFVTEYLLEPEAHEVKYADDGSSIQKGNGAIVVPADHVEGFAFALGWLLEDDELREEMGVKAYQATIPYFTWDNMVRLFLDNIGFEGN